MEPLQLRMLGLLVALAAVLVPVAADGATVLMRRQYDGDITNAIDANGAFECPCLAALPANAAGLLLAKGFPAGTDLTRPDVWRAARFLCDLGLAAHEGETLTHTNESRRPKK